MRTNRVSLNLREDSWGISFYYNVRIRFLKNSKLVKPGSCCVRVTRSTKSQLFFTTFTTCSKQNEPTQLRKQSNNQSCCLQRKMPPPIKQPPLARIPFDRFSNFRNWLLPLVRLIIILPSILISHHLQKEETVAKSSRWIAIPSNKDASSLEIGRVKGKQEVFNLENVTELD